MTVSNATAKFSRLFDLLSQRDPSLNGTLYEDAEFAALVRDVYAALHGTMSLRDRLLGSEPEGAS